MKTLPLVSSLVVVTSTLVLLFRHEAESGAGPGEKVAPIEARMSAATHQRVREVKVSPMQPAGWSTSARREETAADIVERVTTVLRGAGNGDPATRAAEMLCVRGEGEALRRAIEAWADD